MIDSTPNPKATDPPVLDPVALEARLRAAVVASTDQDGELNYDWMVMHIRLVHCDTIRVAHIAEKGSSRAVRTRYAAMILAGEKLLRQVLQAMLPFLAEFADPLECSVWLQENGIRESVQCPAFIEAARAAGLPVVVADLDYALVPRDDREKEVFRGLAQHALLALMQ
jgi:hypothetical protein